MGLFDAIFDNLFGPRADYNGDGKVSAFEEGLFLHEMEMEDKAIAEGKAFFGGPGRKTFDYQEDYIGLDLEHCTILDPDYIGCESLETLVARYGITLTEDDIRFYRETHGGYD